ncbi:hypothetical protein UG55_103151 [Frankia sp. EI5c]|uniref:hypothetical protein n=1 Tax=Frankia sp. EI5c TaxID=683316 RepID=UPI0007C216B1|nr:hypothetical protein [Frankia sp. EI5c]OAA24204.1 hypothetical protein UG55_103151 [Frankia sp. EI5c]
MTDRRLDRMTHVALLTMAAVTAVMVAVGYVGPVRPVTAVVTAALLPGAAVLAWLPRRDFTAWFALACGLSLAAETVFALAMTWLRWWHPEVAAGVVGTAAAASLVLRLRVDSRTRDRARSPAGSGGTP